MSPAFPLQQPHQVFRPNQKGDIISLIFSAHRVASLLVGDGRCICGELTGNAYDPKSHSKPDICPVAVLYRDINDCAEVAF